MGIALHPIKVVVRRTGLTAHVIRIWEKRYEAVKPGRTETNRRLYSEEHIERLGLLRDLTRAGQNIGRIARLPMSKLRSLAAAPRAADAGAGRGDAGPAARVEECLTAVKRLDCPALEAALKRGALELGTHGLLQRVIAPVAQTIGELWREGAITAAHEHFASAAIRLFLGHAARPFAASDAAPVLVVATPTGQLHELGALLAGAVAAHLGWQVTYLGASLPAMEIASVARQNRARAVALSLVYPEDDPRLEGELARLRELLPPEVTLLAGGRALPAYRKVIERIGGLPINDLAHLGSTLDELRKPAAKKH
jgi:DNA-binding transcriptional MerR regulator/methylmalonyl-CoA mutase cobalamin-binding subunit